MTTLVYKYMPRRMTEKLRREILDAAWCCVYCGAADPADVDHVFPVSRGGSDDPENLAAACTRCNAEKSDYTLDEWEARRRKAGKCWPPRTSSAHGEGTSVLARGVELALLVIDLDDLDPRTRPSDGVERIVRLVRDGGSAEEIAEALIRGALLTGGEAR